MRVVVEGPDGSGKTNLVVRFKDRYSDFVMVDKASTSEHGPIEHLDDWVEVDLNRIDRQYTPYLYDRHPLISELIYAPLLGRPLTSRFADPEWLREAMEFFQGLGYWVIYCLPPRDEVIANIHNNHHGTTHQEGVMMNAGPLYDLYYAQWCREVSNPNTLHWDYTEMSWEDFAADWFDGHFEVK